MDPGAQSTGASNLLGIVIDETRSGAGSGFGLGGAITSVKLQTAVGGLSALTTTIGTSLNTLLGAVSTASQPALRAIGASVSASDVRNIDVECQAVRLAA